MADEVDESKKELPIKCIFYSEFDNIKGPQITHQIPEKFQISSIFETISEYIITKPYLCGRLLSMLLTFQLFPFSCFTKKMEKMKNE